MSSENFQVPTEKTRAVYQEDGHLYTHDSTISSIAALTDFPEDIQALFKKTTPGSGSDESNNTPLILTTPSTIFHAQGGGQPSDIGTITISSENENVDEKQASTFHVHQVRKPPPPSSILHLGTLSPSSPSTIQSFAPGTHITQTIDIPTRTLHSRLHTGGHALGLAIYLLTQSGYLPSDLRDGKASHFPSAASVEFHGLIPGSAKDEIQKKVDELVKMDLEIRVEELGWEDAGKRCVSGVEGANVDLGGEEGGGLVRVVDIGGMGAYPCGGTHVRRLGEVGRVVVRGIKRQKGVSKVSYEVVDG